MINGPVSPAWKFEICFVTPFACPFVSFNIFQYFIKGFRCNLSRAIFYPRHTTLRLLLLSDIGHKRYLQQQYRLFLFIFPSTSSFVTSKLARRKQVPTPCHFIVYYLLFLKVLPFSKKKKLIFCQTSGTSSKSTEALQFFSVFSAL